MSPVNLANLPSNSPLLLGRVQVKTAGATGGGSNYNNTISARPLTDAPSLGGNPMRIAVTPQYDCWWRVTAYSIWLSTDAVWSRADWGIDLSPADANGYSRTQCLQWLHSATQWMHSHCTALYRLSANIAYTATMMWIASPSGYNQQTYNHSTYMSIQGHTFSEGRL